MNRRVLLGILPPMVLLVATVLPLVLGHQTFYVRDVLNAHLQMVISLADALGDGRLPLVDVLRGGQPLLGNPNASPLYPTRLLLLVASPLWVLNAHFWIHWLLAPFAMFALGRAWGLGRSAAWTAGVIYATCGFFVSLLNLHNLIAGAALMPAFVAAAMVATQSGHAGHRRIRAGIAMALLWTLLLLAGDPLTALLAMAMAVTAVMVRVGVRRPARDLATAARATAAPVVAGTLIAAPQLVAFWRIVGDSYRGHWGYSRESALAASWHPSTALEWFVPFFFGRPDRSFWGQGFFGGNEPFYLTLFPGVLTLALVLVGWRPRTHAAWWSWGAVVAGLLVALGAYNPLMNALAGLGGGFLRYPIKVWPLIAVGGSLLAGIGFARLENATGRRVLLRILGALGALFALAWWRLGHPSDALRDAVARFTDNALRGSLLGVELERWAALCFLQLVLLGLMAGAVWFSGRRLALGGALLLALHVGSQLFFLQPARDTDAMSFYNEPSPAVTALASDEHPGWTVHGRVGNLFGSPPPARGPAALDARTLWDERLRFGQGFPQAGALAGIPYDLDPTPEGLDAFLSVAFGQALKQQRDGERLRLLAATGVDTLILDRPLDPVALDPGAGALVERTQQVPGTPRPLWIHRLHAAPPVSVASDVRYVGDVNAALEALTDPTSDPASLAVLPGDAPNRQITPSALRVVEQRPESLTVHVEGEGGVLLWQRAHLPIYRATINGESAEIAPGNIHRVAVELPPGRHDVRIWVDRRPLYASIVAVVLGVVLLVALARFGGRLGP